MRSLALVVLVLAVIAVAPAAAQKKLVCYFGSWATYHTGNGKFDVENIAGTPCTHVIYGFVGINPDASVKVLDPWNDLQDNGGLGAFARFNNLRNANPSLKTLVAVGGWNARAETFSAVCNNANLRATFVNNAYNFVTKYGFNGLDIDWEYPANADQGGQPFDKANFVSLISQLKAKFAPSGLLVTAAVGASNSIAATSYNIAQIASNLDAIHLMTYDYHGSWESVTGENGPLFAAAADPDKTLNIDATVQNWLKQGAPASKLVLGIGMYGRTFTLQSATNKGLGAPTTGGGPVGPYTQSEGFLGYNEICEMQMAGGWTVTTHPEQKVPIATKGTFWVGYDNTASIQLKTDYIAKYGLGGAMVWSIDTDDFRGLCGGGKYPLINKIAAGLGSSGTVVTVKPTVGPVTTAPTKATVAPVTPKPSGTFTCSATGYFRDPTNCAMFYYCQATSTGYVKNVFTCGAGTVYNTAGGYCDWPYNVSC